VLVVNNFGGGVKSPLHFRISPESMSLSTMTKPEGFHSSNTTIRIVCLLTMLFTFMEAGFATDLFVRYQRAPLVTIPAVGVTFAIATFIATIHYLRADGEQDGVFLFLIL
jgi:hypothetical protein